jgi:uncharacterized protein (TIGR02145 family)
MNMKHKSNIWPGTSMITGIFLILIFIYSCKKDASTAVIESGSVTDIDSNVYNTVKIGNQWWMAEDLKVKRYRNGDSIVLVGNIGQYSTQFDTSTWANIDSGAYCINNGYKYNWYTIADIRNIAPVGWHVPSDDEWKELEMQLGMSESDADTVNWRGTTEGNKLKLQSGWYYNTDYADNTKYKVWGTNESGFSALGGGCIMFDGADGQPGATYSGFWWSASKHGTQAWYRYLDYQKASVFRFYGPMAYGFSLRCVKDE